VLATLTSPGREAPVPKSANWAVGSGVAISILAYEYCQYQRRVERANMKRVVEVVTKKQADMKKKEEEEKKQMKLQSRADMVAPTDKTNNKAWYKFW
jgi:cytochrome c oxidase assembly protein subunit 20